MTVLDDYLRAIKERESKAMGEEGSFRLLAESWDDVPRLVETLEAALKFMEMLPCPRCSVTWTISETQHHDYERPEAACRRCNGAKKARVVFEKQMEESARTQPKS